MSYNTTAPQVLIKQPYDVAIYSMSFEALLSGGETISTIDSITSDPSDGVLIISNETISGGFVLMKIAGGTHNTNYRIEVRITTSLSNKFEGDGILKVRDN